MKTVSVSPKKAVLVPSLLFIAGAVLCSSVPAADYRVERLAESPPSSELPAEIVGQLADSGVRVIRGASATYCDMWLVKEWSVKADFQPSTSILYPFQPGQLMGVVRFARKGADFRGQDIARGVYTLRYAHQPVDGAHVGTSPTYDFLLLVRVEDEESAELTDLRTLSRLSAEAAESNHPSILSMRPLKSSSEYPALRHQKAEDWWVLGLKGRAKTAAVVDFPIDLVIFGQAAE